MTSTIKFDRLSFVKYMKGIGRPYRMQAVELVSICRTFLQTKESAPAPVAEADTSLRNALTFVDDALKSAAKAGKRTSKEVDEKFRQAIETLSDYEKRFHPNRSVSNDHHATTVRERMAVALAKDKSYIMTLNRLRERPHAIQVGLETTTIVEFLLHKSLPDKSPTIVKQVLDQKSSLAEILWNFSRFKDPNKRVTRKQNPHLYAGLPTSPEEYDDQFRSDPIEAFPSLHARISVLTANPWGGRLYLETTQGIRAFDNIWIPNNAIIFKDVCGRLEGESIVGAAIQDKTNLWYFEGDSKIGVPIRDWREPIRRILQFPSVNINIYITTKPPSSSSPGDLPPYFTIPSAVSSRSDGGPLTPSSEDIGWTSPLSQRPPTPLSDDIAWPHLFDRPSTPSSYDTAWTTHLFDRPSTPSSYISARTSYLSQEPFDSFGL